MVTRFYERKHNCLVCGCKLLCIRSADGSYSVGCACAVTTYSADQWRGTDFELMIVQCDCGGRIATHESLTSFFPDYKCERCGKPYYPGEAS